MDASGSPDPGLTITLSKWEVLSLTLKVESMSVAVGEEKLLQITSFH